MNTIPGYSTLTQNNLPSMVLEAISIIDPIEHHAARSITTIADRIPLTLNHCSAKVARPTASIIPIIVGM